MRLITSSLALFLSIIIVGASVPHGNLEISARHSRLVHRATSLEARAPEKRCPNRINKKANSTTVNLDFLLFSSLVLSQPRLLITSSRTSRAPNQRLLLPRQPPLPHPPSKLVLVDSFKSIPIVVLAVLLVRVGVPHITFSPDPGFIGEITRLSGPNGHIDWLNCGFETAGGWQPPHVRVQDVVTQSLSSALQSPSSPFKACSRYIRIFEQYGNQYGIPPIILASFAMQESGCNPETVGGGGEQGLMQITREKCGGAPGGNCREPVSPFPP